MRDGVMRDGVMRDGVMRDGVMRDGVYQFNTNCFLRWNLDRAIVDPALEKKVELPQESCVSHMRVGRFHHHFLHCSSPYIFLLNTFSTEVGTHQRIMKICVSKSYRNFKIAKN